MTKVENDVWQRAIYALEDSDYSWKRKLAGELQAVLAASPPKVSNQLQTDVAVESDDGDISDEQFAALKASVTVPPLIPVESGLVEKARRICAEARPDYAEGFLSGEYDQSSTEMRAALLALATSGEVTEAMLLRGCNAAFEVGYKISPEALRIAMCAAQVGG